MGIPHRLNTLPAKQMRFDFERREVEDAAAHMKRRIAQAVAEEGALLLADLVDALSEGTAPWTKTKTIAILQELIHDNYIIFEDHDGPIEKYRALQLLFQAAEWKQTRVVHAPLVGEQDLATARELAAEMLDVDVPGGQNPLCRLWRSRLLQWKNTLQRFKPMADTGRYPGKDTIDEICAETENMLSCHDPCRFIAAINARGRRLLDYDGGVALLRHFYTREIDAWQVMLEALETFEPNREVLAEDPRSKASLKVLYETLQDTEPYGKTGGLLGHIVTVKEVNDEIRERQTVAAREQAMPQVQQMVSRLSRALNDVGADSDLRNRALHPLHVAAKAIHRADSARAVDELLTRAADQADLAMDMISEQGGKAAHGRDAFSHPSRIRNED